MYIKCNLKKNLLNLELLSMTEDRRSLKSSNYTYRIRKKIDVMINRYYFNENVKIMIFIAVVCP